MRTSELALIALFTGFWVASTDACQSADTKTKAATSKGDVSSLDIDFSDHLERGLLSAPTTFKPIGGDKALTLEGDAKVLSDVAENYDKFKNSTTGAIYVELFGSEKKDSSAFHVIRMESARRAQPTDTAGNGPTLVSGTLTRQGDSKAMPYKDFRFRLSPDKQVQIKLTGAAFVLMGPANDLVKDATEWQGKVPKEADYIIRVHVKKEDATKAAVAYQLSVDVK